jgi:hypothetical protein
MNLQMLYNEAAIFLPSRNGNCDDKNVKILKG